MADVLVRGLDLDTIERLQLRAERHGRSLQGELKALLEAAARELPTQPEAIARITALRESLPIAAGDAVESVREDRKGDGLYR